jgi:TPP-dependent pyruvate/acetoin dehydrogenase alpha subunit
MLLSIWDDGYGISVPNEQQIAKRDLSELLRGVQRQPGADEGLELFTVKGWDYPALLETYRRAADLVRKDHVPAILHVTELTQPQGHSTSGSHERYKSPERLAWEAEHDCLARLRRLLLERGIAGEEELKELEQRETAAVRAARDRAWTELCAPIEEAHARSGRRH